MATYEMFWDCAYCGTTKLLGKSHRYCPNCGAPQDASSRYFPSESEKVAVEDHVYVGVDKECPACETPNAANSVHCVSCGGALDGSTEVSRRETVENLPTAADEAEPTPPPLPRAPSTSELRRARIKKALMLFAAFVVISIPLLLWSRDTSVTVVEHSWERAVHIEKFAAHSDGDWCDSMPADAYSVSRSTQQRGTRSVPDGETCSYECSTSNVDNGDGTFSQVEDCGEVCTTTYREEPVYDQWCDYTVNRWGHERTETSAARDLTPLWPTYSVSDCASLGCTRVSSRDETYRVHFVDADEVEQTCEYDEEIWSGFLVEQELQARKRVLTGWMVCDSVL
jgi:hypothetical protein